MFEVLSMVMAGFIVLILALPWLVIVFSPLVLLLSLIGLPIIAWLSKSIQMLKVLVVDDDEISIAPVLAALKKYSHPVKVHFARGSRDALRYLQNIKFDLMILDYMMPELKGDELLDAAEKSQDVHPRTPVVFYTGNSNVSGLKSKIYKKFIVLDIWKKKISFTSLRLKLSSQLQACS